MRICVDLQPGFCFWITSGKLRSERAISAAMAEMYIQGVATRSVKKILEKMCGLEVSAMQVSRATKTLDEEFEKWRNRPIKESVKY